MTLVETETPRQGSRTRTCVGCRSRISAADAEASFRVVLGLVAPGGGHEIAVDLAGGSFGRGAHVHATPACIAKACCGGLARAFRCQVTSNEASLARSLVAAADRRIEGLLIGARRAGLLAFGEEAKGAVAKGVPLTLVAKDAGSSALGGPLRQAVAEGRVLAWRTKVELGFLFSRELVALVAVRHEAVAHQIQRAARLAESARECVGDAPGAGPIAAG